MERKLLNIVGYYSRLLVVDLRDLLHIRRRALVNDQSQIPAAREAILPFELRGYVRWDPTV